MPDEWFEVREAHNARTVAGSGPHVVAASLFWKNLKADEPDLPPLTHESLKNAVRIGLVKRLEPWSHYLQPLLDGAEKLALARPEIVFRIYLAADLEFLIEDFVKLNCEVQVMKGNSISHNPGAMWRFLALEHDGLVTITDEYRACDVIHDVKASTPLTVIDRHYISIPVRKA